MLTKDRSLDYPSEWLSEDANVLARAIEGICTAAGNGDLPSEQILRIAKIKAGQIQAGIAAWQSQGEKGERSEKR